MDVYECRSDDRLRGRVMRGDGGDAFPSFDIEIARAAYELRKPDAQRRAVQALGRARRDADHGQARALAGLLADHGNRRLADEDVGPTPETLVHLRRRRGDTIEALVANKRLAWHQQGAAMSIASVYEALTATLAARGASWELGRVDGGGCVGIPERLARLYSRRFRPWAAWMRHPASMFQLCVRCVRLPVQYRAAECDCGARRIWRAPPHLSLVLAVVVLGVGIEAAAITYGMRRTRALRLLRLGLDRFCDFV